MEKVLTGASGRDVDQATVLALKKFMEAVASTRSLLVLIGLPDFLETLPEDIHQRISAQIIPSPMTADDITQYVREAQKHKVGHARLEPFSRDSIAYIADLTGGNARRVVRLCYLAYQAASVSGTQVTRTSLREVTRDQFESVPLSDVFTEVARILDSTGWSYQRDATINKETATKIDFWLPIGGTNEVGLIVTLSRSLLYKRDVDDIVSRVQPWKSRTKGLIIAVLVVNGYLTENLACPVKGIFDRVLYYGSRGFRDSFEAVVHGFRERLEASTQRDTLGRVGERVDELSRQVNYLIDETQHIRRDVPRREDIEVSVTAGLRRFFAETSDATREVSGFGPAYRVIDEAQDSVREARNLLATMSSEDVERAPTNDTLAKMDMRLDKFRTELTGVLRDYGGEEVSQLLSAVEVLCKRADKVFTELVRDLESPDILPLHPAQVEVAVRLRPLTEFGNDVWKAVRQSSQGS